MTDGWQLAASGVKREEIVETALEAIGDAVFLFDAEARIVEMNRAGRRLLGSATPRVVSAQPSASATTLEIPINLRLRDTDGRPFKEVKSPIWRVLHGERLTAGHAVDASLRGSDGCTAEVEVAGVPLRVADHVVGAVLVLRDVTERRRLEMRVRSALDALLETVEALMDGAVHEEKMVGNALDATPKLARRIANLACGLLDYRQGVVAAVEPTTEVIHVLASVGGTSAANRSVRESFEGSRLAKNVSDGTDERRVRSGAVHAVKLYLAEYRSKRPFAAFNNALVVPMVIDKRLIGVILLNRTNGHGGARIARSDDALARSVGKLAALVLERDRLFREREKVRADSLALQEADRRMYQFLSIVAHELRTPVTAIKLHLQLMMRRARRSADEHQADLSREPWAGFVDQLEDADRQADRIARLVNNLLDVERIRDGSFHLRLSRYELVTHIRSIVAECERDYPERSILANYEAVQSLWILGDAARIGLVVAHLISNAAKYSAEHLPIAVEVRHQDQSSAYVSVRDEGGGIPPEELQRLWQPFYRARGVQTQSGSSVGFGIGLNLCKAIVEQHGGTIGVESAVGEGSTFWFTLPLANDVPS